VAEQPRKRASAARATPALAPDPLVDALIPDPAQAPPDVIVMAGHLGRSPVAGRWRLYLAIDLSDFVEVAEDDIMFSRSIDGDLGGTALWIKASASLERGTTTTQQTAAGFLQGKLTDAYLGQAASDYWPEGAIDPGIITFKCPSRGCPTLRCTPGCPTPHCPSIRCPTPRTQWCTKPAICGATMVGCTAMCTHGIC
jgi:hypothetical protein